MKFGDNQRCPFCHSNDLEINMKWDEWVKHGWALHYNYWHCKSCHKDFDLGKEIKNR